MINNIASRGVHAADVTALRQNRSKTTSEKQDPAVETAEKGKAHQDQHRPPGPARAAENIAGKIFKSADADGSGGISKEELSSALSKRAARISSDDLFTALDSNTDAVVSQTELQDALKKYFYSRVGIVYEPTAPASDSSTESSTISDSTPTVPAESTFAAGA